MKMLPGLLLVIFSSFYPSQSLRLGRIIGGDPAYPAEFPSAAAIYVQTNNGRYFCGGSLIGPQWILTAGQCVDNAIDFTIHLGSNSLSDDGNVNKLILSSGDYVLHPDYNPETLENDVGLIKLRMPIVYSEYIQRIYLAYGNLSDYTNLLATGWGQTSDMDSNLSNTLRKVSVASVPLEDCQRIYGAQVNERNVCVAGEYNQGTCWGDTGSALVHMDATTRTARHVGIASFISGNGCETTDPSGFTRTYTYKSWITDVTGIIS